MKTSNLFFFLLRTLSGSYVSLFGPFDHFTPPFLAQMVLLSLRKIGLPFPREALPEPFAGMSAFLFAHLPFLLTFFFASS